MQHRLVVFLVLLGLAAAAYPTLGAAPGVPETRAFTLVAEPIPCASEDDGICLGYNGMIPGPTLDVNLGDTVVITLVNHYSAPVSWHVHGTVLASSMDGILSHPGTQLIESVAPPGGSFTYTVRAGYAGAWHYHDHVLGADGSEGVHRGLYGSLVVRSGAEPRPLEVYDLHMLDTGANGGRGFAKVTNASSFEVIVVGLGNLFPQVTLRDPNNVILDTMRIGPGMSDRFVVNETTVGEYTLKSPGFTGTVEVI